MRWNYIHKIYGLLEQKHFFCEMISNQIDSIINE